MSVQLKTKDHADAAGHSLPVGTYESWMMVKGEQYHMIFPKNTYSNAPQKYTQNVLRTKL